MSLNVFPMSDLYNVLNGASLDDLKEGARLLKKTYRLQKTFVPSEPIQNELDALTKQLYVGTKFMFYERTNNDKSNPNFGYYQIIMLGIDSLNDVKLLIKAPKLKEFL